MGNEQLIKDVIKWVITTKNTEMLDDSDVDLVYKDYIAEQVGNALEADACAQLCDSNATTGWRSVKDRLPNDGDDILAYDENNGINILYFEDKIWSSETHVYTQVTHWMPLPGAPEV